jgi:hypothetical protein
MYHCPNNHSALTSDVKVRLVLGFFVDHTSMPVLNHSSTPDKIVQLFIDDTLSVLMHIISKYHEEGVVRQIVIFQTRTRILFSEHLGFINQGGEASRYPQDVISISKDHLNYIQII